ncbi:hypothetical protein BHE97_17645 [Aeromicrobium sp. PE09-221]|nr:hypothetical protein BHE97_17645 [Aeromicrobium sp. PE09-221]
MVAAVLVVLMATAGLVAAADFDKRVTLDVDGVVTETRTSAETVDELLTSKGVEPRQEDKLSHELDETVQNNDTVTVRYAKPVTVVVDGESTDEISYATTVGDLLDDLEVAPEKGAYLSSDADETINRFGEEIVVSNPKTLTVTADGESNEIETNKPTVGDVLDEAGVKLDEDDEVDPGLESFVAADTALKVVRIEKITRTESVPIDFETEVTEDGELEKGEKEVVTEGEAGEASEEVNLVLADGEVREREVVSRSTVREPVSRVERHGTKEPEITSNAPAVPGDSVFDRLAQCESGGNWAANTGNGYYGGVQFSAQTWRSVGGAGLPHENSREEQIHRATILQQRSGWGQWPACARKLGLL